MIAIVPPEYFGPLETASLMVHADEIVLLDTVQYSRQSYENRARIRNPQGWQWLTIPVESGQHGQPIAATRIDPEARWQYRHCKALRFNYNTSPYLDFFRPRLTAVLDESFVYLADATVQSMQSIIDMLNLDVRLTRASSMSGLPNTVEDVLAVRPAAELLVPMSRSEAVTQPGRMLTFSEAPYRQNFDGYESDLSVLDLVLNLGPRSIPYLRENTTLS